MVQQQEVVLKVQEALQEEAYKGIVRIDAQTMRQIDIRAGDIIEIEGGRKTVGIVDRSYPSDIGQNIIRMDGILRRNAKTGIGENVKVRKVEVKEAKSVTIAPAQQGVMIQANNELFKQGLLGRAVVKGDIISLGGARRRRRTLSGSSFDDIFNVFEEGFMGNFGFGSLKFIVAESNPKGAVIITENSEVKVSSKSVQVTDERVPEVTYEDIGGLDEEVKKLREMVELPIKNPEIFERLGVEPPKGVLLYGPPGTGKTLLAKAVANEAEANFLLVNGPELTCVGGDTDVLTNPEGRVKIKDLFEEAKKNGEVYVKDAIKEIVIPKQPIKLFSVNDNLKVVKNEVKAITRLNAPSYYTIKTKKKGDLITSKNHPLATIDAEGNLIWKRAEELQEGDYIAIASHVPTNEKNPEVTWWKNLDQQYTLTKIKGKEIRLHAVKDRQAIKGIKYSSIKSNDARAKYIKPVFKITPLFTEFLGAMYSEGYIGADEVVIAGDDPFLQKKYKNYFKDLFGIGDERIAIKKAPHGKVTVYSTILAELLTKGFGLPRHKKPKDEPLTPWLFQCRKESIAAFIRGYFNGDGNEGWEKENYPTPIIYSSSKEFLLDIQILLLQLGIVSKVTKAVTGMGNLLYAVEILDTEGRELFAKYIIKDYKKELFDKWFATRTKQGSSEVIPQIAPLLKKIKQKLRLTYNKEIPEVNYEPVISGRFTLTYRNAKRLLTLFKKYIHKNKAATQDIEKVEKIVNADIKWDKIIEIKKQNEPTVLYDLTMKGPANYLGGSPLFLMHNSKFYGESEKRIRDLFEEAEKNAPSIIFIDEIDAMAPKRDETYGEVERRMVAQLLSMMDGLKSRGKVIVIGATNRPNSIDPALRRPGRFDREICIGVPNKKGRLNILKIHTRNMPIEGTMYPEILAKITHTKTEEYLKENKIEKEKIEEQLSELKTKKSGEKSLVDKLFNKLTEMNSKIEKTENILKIIKNKEKLEELSKELSGLETNIKKWEKEDIEDIRLNFLEKSKRRLSNELYIVLKDLLDLKVINSSTYDEFREEGKKRDIENLADITHGFVGADLQALCKEAAMNVIRRVLPELKYESEKIPPEVISKLKIKPNEDFKTALKLVRPSALREVLVEKPNVHWDDIGGLHELKQQLKEAVEWPLKNPKMFSRMGIKPPRGILIYGPPGTGKTMLAKAVANESEANFISVKGPEILNKFVGESEKGVRKIFEKARQTAPTIIFFDEVDSIAPRRGTEIGSNVTERIVNTLLVEMDGLEELTDVVVIAATNRPDLVDPSLLRPGRFDRIIAAPMPGRESRKSILQVHIGKMPLAKDIDIDKITERTEGYSGADLSGLVREAAMIALRKNVEAQEVTHADFEEALKKVHPSLREEDLKRYKEVEDKYLRKAKIAAVVTQKPSYLG